MNNLTSNSTNQLSIREAANICGKSIHTIKKLIQENKIKSTKVVGKFGRESRIALEEIVSYYGPNIINLGARIVEEESNKGFNKISNDTPNNDLLNQYIIDQNDFLKKEIESLRKDKERMQLENDERRKEVEKIHTLLENQQTLSLGLQGQIKSLTDSITTLNWNGNDQSVSEVKIESPRKKRFWLF
jgi:ABC-type phosphate transport system auxiliary subunit